MTPEEIRLLRLWNQGLLSPAPVSPSRLVAAMTAMQAQEYSMAKWAVGLRTPHAAEPDVEAAFQRGEILRTHLLRPTWHFVAPEDIRWLLSLTAPHVHRANASLYRREGLDEETRRNTRRILEKSLVKTPAQTRSALAETLSANGIAAGGHRLSYIMMDAELEGLVCSGPRVGKQFTYALLDAIVPPSALPARDEALALLSERYFETRGPATVEDYSAWSGLPVRDARAGAASLPVRFVREGGYYLPQPPSGLSLNERATFLLPDYDEYGMSYRNRDALAPRRTPEAQPSDYSHWLVIGGRIEGTWTFCGGRRGVAAAHPYRPPQREEERDIQSAVEAYRAFWEPAP